MTTIAVAETCLDDYVQYFSTNQTVGGEDRPAISPADPDFPRRMQRTHLQRAAAHYGHNYTVDEVSIALQAYRSSQGRDGRLLKYGIAARGYARGAWWYLLDGPGFNRHVSEQMLLAQTKWVPEDAAHRAAMDVICELIPAMEPSDTAVNRIVGTCEIGISTMLRLMVTQITTQVDIGAATLSIPTTDVVLPVELTVLEESLLADLLA